MTDTASPAGYPHWDNAYAGTLESTDEVHVTVDVDPTEDGSTLVIRRTVWRKAHRRSDRHVLWIGDVARIPRMAAAEFVGEIVAALST